MLSLESIMEMRIENSKAYYVFYEFFYKSAVGEVHWKECLDGDARRIGNDTTESFALLLLANNYKAWWLYEKKGVMVKSYRPSMTPAPAMGVSPLLINSW